MCKGHTDKLTKNVLEEEDGSPFFYVVDFFIVLWIVCFSASPTAGEATCAIGVSWQSSPLADTLQNQLLGRCSSSAFVSSALAKRAWKMLMEGYPAPARGGGGVFINFNGGRWMQEARGRRQLIREKNSPAFRFPKRAHLRPAARLSRPFRRAVGRYADSMDQQARQSCRSSQSS